MWPCIGHIQPGTRKIYPISFGRGPTFYGHNKLLSFLHDCRVQAEKNAVEHIVKANELIPLLKKPIENQQEQEEQEVRLLPVELLSHIFEYLDPLEIVKSVMSTCQHWRAIGLEVLVIRLRKLANNVSDPLIVYSESNKEIKEIKINPDKEIVSVCDLSKRAKKLYRMIEILQRLVVYCK